MISLNTALENQSLVNESMMVQFNVQRQVNALKEVGFTPTHVLCTEKHLKQLAENSNWEWQQLTTGHCYGLDIIFSTMGNDDPVVFELTEEEAAVFKNLVADPVLGVSASDKKTFRIFT